MTARTPRRFCAGLGMRTCRDCRHNVENHPGTAPVRFFEPAASPPARCMDWQALPVRAADSTHGRL